MDYGTDVTLLSSIGCGRTFLEYEMYKRGLQSNK